MTELSEMDLKDHENSSELAIEPQWLRTRVNGITALFSGQGSHPLKCLKKNYPDLDAVTKSLLEELSTCLEEEVQETGEISFAFSQGFDILDWITSESAPTLEYLYSSPVSYPLIFVSQVIQYFCFLKRIQLSHAQFLETYLKATVGHSQGVISALWLSMSSDVTSLVSNAKQLVVYMFWQGIACYEQLKKLSKRVLKFNEDDVSYSPMLNVTGLSVEQLKKVIAKVELLEMKRKQYLDAFDEGSSTNKEKKLSVAIALINGPEAVVLSGPPTELQLVARALTEISAKPDESQARIPFPNRKPKITARFLRVGAAFHNELNDGVLSFIQKKFELDIKGSELKVPVFNLPDGANLQDSNENVFQTLVKAQSTLPNDFVKTLEWTISASEVSHIVDFGPGYGLGSMCSDILVGTGKEIVSIDAAVGLSKPAFYSINALESHLEKNSLAWKKALAPMNVQRAVDNKFFLFTKFTSLTGKPPVMMAGMTPCTSLNGLDLVAACSNGGFHCELAAGGLPTPAIFRASVEALCAKLNKGMGICFNLLYLNPRQWAFQFPLLLQLAREGFPIESITIGAGIPSLEKAGEIIDSLLSVGVTYMGFKPGNLAAITEVIAIAKHRPQMSILLQWTGGRAGGHHSCEDFHRPLLQAYAKIRAVDNIVLVVGSGFGDAEACFPYFSGTWAQKYALSYGKLMPVDAVLLGSRCMVAKEARTSEAVKTLIIDTPGISEEIEWVNAYDSEAGGVLSVKSELGEQIHMIANRGSRCWRWMEDSFFCVKDKEAFVKKVEKHKWAIVDRLNSDFQKPFFGQKLDGQVCDIADMTYFEVLHRLVSFTFIADKSWVDETYFKRVSLLLARFYEIFLPNSEFSPSNLKTKPFEELEKFKIASLEVTETLIANRDIDFFLYLCRDRKFGKPVNFVPAINADLQYWFKKDSLWYSEFLEAVPGNDAQRVCILHGPMAAKYSTTKDEGICDILGNIHDGCLVKLASDPLPVSIVGSNFDIDATWQDVVLKTPKILNNKKWEANPIQGLFEQFSVEQIDGKFVLREADVSVGTVAFDKKSNVITLEVIDSDLKDSSLKVFLRYCPELNKAPLQYVEEKGKHFNICVKDYYRQIWNCSKTVNLYDTFTQEHTVTTEEILKFNESLGIATDKATLDLATVVCWGALTRVLFSKELDLNLLDLVHLFNRIEVLTESFIPFEAGEIVVSKGKLLVLEVVENMGTRITVECLLLRDSVPAIKVTTGFLVRSKNKASSKTILKTKTIEGLFHIKNYSILAQLQQLPTKSQSKIPEVGDVYYLSLSSKSEALTVDLKFIGNFATSDVEPLRLGLYRSKSESLEVTTNIEVQGEETTEALTYFEVNTVVNGENRPLNTGGYSVGNPYTFTTPSESVSYSNASQDWNPIHRTKQFAFLAGLPEAKPIVHGMWTAATIRVLLENHFKGCTMMSYEVNFDDMVYHGEEIALFTRHVGFIEGERALEFEARSVKTEARVVSGKCLVKQQSSGYLFTGQGSAVVNMGMDKYAEVPAAKRVWDKAEKYLKENFGFSILEIVKKNPKSLTVHFGGKKGELLRKNYLNIVDDKGRQIIRSIDASTKSFTFRAVNGLLFATQFSQPALVLVQKAAFEELVAMGQVPGKSFFAGHSLGEYAALASYAEVLTVEDLVDTVFKRGLVMQNAVERDEYGRSDYGMIAASPLRVSKKFSASKLEAIVKAIDSKYPDLLLQVVNYNIQDQQYVVAGEKVMLATFRIVLNNLQANLDANVDDLIKEAYESASAEYQKQGKKYQLQRGVATIPLDGIDVPFHSRKLLPGVPAFRKLLLPKLVKTKIEKVLHLLEGSYIPNVVAAPFSTSLDYVKKVYDTTGSEVLKKLIDTNETDKGTIATSLVVELLAYQFAMPVRWIETQHILFSRRIVRLVEMGPAPVLKIMAKKALATGLYGKDYNPKLFWWKQDYSEICYDLEDKGVTPTEFFDKTSPDSVDDESVAEIQETQQVQPVLMSSPVMSSSPIQCSLSPLNAIRLLVSLKLKLGLNEISAQDSLAKLSKGKSAVQNEIVGDLGKEFGLTAEFDVEAPLSTVATAVDSYPTLGPVLSNMLKKALQSKLPGSFALSAVKAHLTSNWSVASDSSDSVLVFGLTSLPPSRMKTAEEVKTWIKATCELFSKEEGTSLSEVSSQGGASPILSQQPSTAPAAMIPDIGIEALHALKVLLATKFKLKLSEIRDSDSIKLLSKGKSALQNEIMGDLGTEFNFQQEADPEAPLSQLAQLVTGYNAPGKLLKQTLQKLISTSFSPGFNMKKVETQLSQKGLGPKRAIAVMIHGLASPPQKRCASDQAVTSWLDSTASGYAAYVGISLSSAQVVSSTGTVVTGRDPRIDKVQLFLQRQQETYNEMFGSTVETVSLNPISSHHLSDEVSNELGESFLKMIMPQFSKQKQRVYSSYWNWVVQDALEMHYHIFARIRNAEHIPNKDNKHYQAMASVILSSINQLTEQSVPKAWFKNFLCNRATPELLQDVQYFAQTMQAQGYPEYAQAISFLAEQVKRWMDLPPVFVASFESLSPKTQVKGNKLDYVEVPRAEGADGVAYVAEMSRGLEYNKSVPSQIKNPQQVHLLSQDSSMILDDSSSQAARKPRTEEEIKTATLARLPSGERLEVLRGTIKSRGLSEYEAIHIHKADPYLNVKSSSELDKSIRIVDEVKTSLYLSGLHELSTCGVSFSGQVALVTGASKESIAFEVIRGLLEGGATVITTFREPRESDKVNHRHQAFRELYEKCGSKGSKLITLPCNCISSQDILQVVDHIYTELDLDIDFVVPFAAATEVGVDIGGIGSKSEAYLRLTLTNIMRLVGAIKNQKAKRNIDTRPALVVVPCSPNHGEFGMDGLYAEAKLACESLMAKWYSEGWEDYLNIACAVIGWTRSSLMEQNNIVAEGVEKLGLRTFSTSEMAFNILGILHPRMVSLATEAPLYMDFTGNWNSVKNLKAAVEDIRGNLKNQAKIGGFPSRELSNKGAMVAKPLEMLPKFPQKMSAERMKSLAYLEGCVSLRKTVVCVGYGEIGPWGNSRTRWEYEASGAFSLEGCIELAWLLGYITYHNGPLGNGEFYIGWIDAATKEAVKDFEVKQRYESQILKNSGIRLIDPSLFEGYSPEKKRVFRQVALSRNMEPVAVTSVEEAEEYVREAGEEFVKVTKKDDEIFVQLLKGAEISVPRAMRFDRQVAGQIPKGWDPKRLGLPPEIVNSVDPVTLFALISTVEALLSAGLCDPYELYQYVHLSQVGNTSGGGMGGMRSLKRMFFQRKMDIDIPSDTLAESFINTMPAWINMLLLSSAGPIKTPVGACATAAESIDIGVETILADKARVVITGGYDDFGETGSYEFAQMGATNSSDEDFKRGRQPVEASRPMTSSRAGFVEAQGCGMQVLMDAELAIEMGLPIYGIVALTNTATDKQGRSVPAPGRGILTTARESTESVEEREMLLSFSYRAKYMKQELECIDTWYLSQTPNTDAERRVLEKQVLKKREAVFDTWGNGFYKNNTSIAPIKGALAVWGLSMDDLAVGSFHGTSTKLNDVNESAVFNKQMEHLGRSKGNILLAISQKYLTGHPKGAAAAWMFNGLLQCMQDKVVPGNRNLDDVDVKLRENAYLLYPNRAIELPKIEAAMLKSFGFGQAGAEVIVVHPDYCLAVLDEASRDVYYAKLKSRERATYRYFNDVYSNVKPLVQIKNSPPYSSDMEEEVYLDPKARATFSESTQTWQFSGERAKSKSLTVKASVSSSTKQIEETVVGLHKDVKGEKGIGVDLEPVATFAEFEEKQNFIRLNFTENEIAYCKAAPDPAASFAGKWAAKEALLKAITSASDGSVKLWKNAAAPLKSIETSHNAAGCPVITLSGYPKQVFQQLKLTEIKVSISHSDEHAIAHVIVL